MRPLTFHEPLPFAAHVTKAGCVERADLERVLLEVPATKMPQMVSQAQFCSEQSAQVVSGCICRLTSMNEAYIYIMVYTYIYGEREREREREREGRTEGGGRGRETLQ